MAEKAWVTRPVEKSDLAAWRRLFIGYCTFYEWEPSEEQLSRVWSWIHDEGSVKAVVVVAGDGCGEPVGLAHLRPWVRPLRGAQTRGSGEVLHDFDFYLQITCPNI